MKCCFSSQRSTYFTILDILHWQEQNASTWLFKNYAADQSDAINTLWIEGFSIFTPKASLSCVRYACPSVALPIALGASLNICMCIRYIKYKNYIKFIIYYYYIIIYYYIVIYYYITIYYYIAYYNIIHYTYILYNYNILLYTIHNFLNKCILYI